MDNSFHQQEPDRLKKRFFAGLQIFESILPLMWRSINWLADFIKLTEEEQADAGLFLGHLGNE